MTNNDFPSRQYAMEYGTFLGIAWTIVFIIYVMGFRTGNGLFFFLGLTGLACLLILPFIFAWRIKKLQPDNEGLGFIRALSFTINLFMFACIFTGACEFVYFNYMDGGQLTEAVRKMFTSPEMKEAYTNMGLSETYSQMQDNLTQVSNLSAFEKTEMLFNSNFLFSVILFLPVSLVASLENKTKL